MNSKYSFLPKEIMTVGISLDPLGINEIAWKYDDALAVIECITAKGYPILGGDVYSFSRDLIELTYDSWYLNESDNKDFIQESSKKAIEYINNYNTRNGKSYIYSITY